MIGYLEVAGVVETALFRSDVADVVARVDTGEDLEAERVRGRDLDHRQALTCIAEVLDRLT